ncbi:MAG TPA: hypothetical protein VG370_22690 [Chloroflexota bacterium]|jgi:hypothetical protein|nr:hypothetical protein [Chloroflexota bacterium]
MQLFDRDVVGRFAADRDHPEPRQADPIVDSFAPLCAEAEALCRRLDPALRRMDALCARLGLLVGRLTAVRVH